MSLSKKEIRVHVRGFYKFLDKGWIFQFKKMRGCRGQIFGWEDRKNVVVQIDFRCDIIPTLLHEFFHYQYPKLSETNIRILESKFVNSLSHSQVKNIIKKWANSL